METEIEKGKYKGSEKESKKNRKRENKVYTLDNLCCLRLLDHCSLNGENRSTCCCGHSMSVKSLSAVRRITMVSLACRGKPGLSGSCDLIT